MNNHILYTNTDVDRPRSVCDQNGDVVLGLCKRCNRAEIELNELCEVNMSNVIEEIEQLKELHRMQLTAISTITPCNTPRSFDAQRIGRDNPYWTQTYEDVCTVMEREITLLEAIDKIHRITKEI